MSCHTGVNIVNDDLIFHYDLNDTKKCFHGEPTTNLIPSPSVNARFSPGNIWGTYNTIQYNSATYFSIGTIDNITDNIVTLSSVDRVINTFDVLTPNATGGGVTIGVSYFIKKISETQFSLHAYNGSQDGTEGYVNPSTGYHKVHDSIALDQRVSISLTNFPTMWRGLAHMANARTVKELILDEGPQGQNFMRLHVCRERRNTEVDDGMAYNVYAAVTEGDIVNFSWWQRCHGEQKIKFSTYFGSGFDTLIVEDIGTEKGKWEKKSYQFVATNTTSVYSYFFINDAGSPYYIDICDYQVEVNTDSGDTQFIAGTRTVDEVIEDVATNTPLSIVGDPTYGDNSITFPESYDKYIQHPYPERMMMGTDNFSMIQWLESLDTGRTIILEARASSLVGYLWAINYPIAGSMSIFLNDNETSTQTILNSNKNDIQVGLQCLGIIVDRENSIVKMYINGELWDTVAIPHSISITEELSYGKHYDIGYDQGQTLSNFTTYSFSHYLKALTDDEMKANFNATRNKYGI